MKWHPLFDRFENVVRRERENAKSWEGVTFRSVEMGFAKHKHLLSGEGSWKAGGRWNAPEVFSAVYGSLRQGTAAEEAFALAADFALAPTEIKPRIIVGIAWKLPAVLDLMTNPPAEARDLPGG